MSQNTIVQSPAENSTPKKTGTPRSSSIMDDAPLFAGLDDYILNQTARMEADTAKTALAKERKKTVQRQTKKAAPEQPTPRKIAKAQQGPSTASNPVLLSVTEICALLKISRATLVRMDKSGQLPGRLKVGGSVRFHRETIETWLQSLITTRPFPS